MYFKDIVTNNTFVENSTNLSDELLVTLCKTDSNTNMYFKTLYYDVLVYARYLAENGVSLFEKEYWGENHNHEYMLYVSRT